MPVSRYPTPGNSVTPRKSDNSLNTALLLQWLVRKHIFKTQHTAIAIDVHSVYLSLLT